LEKKADSASNSRNSNRQSNDQSGQAALSAHTPLPPVALIGGYGGVLPFVALSLCLALGQDLTAIGIPKPAHTLLQYAAIIISFIGAVHWGVALAADAKVSGQRKNYLFAYSVVPALVAFALLLLPSAVALTGMALMVVLLYAVDRMLLFSLVDSSYQTLRLHLTCVVAVSLVVAAMAV